MIPERKIAIAVIKRYRENLDDTLRPTVVPEMFVQKQTDNAIFFAMGGDERPDVEDAATKRLENNLKEAFKEINTDLMKHVQEEYDARLTETIDAAMARIEDYLVKEFTNEELDRLSEIVEDGLVLKLFDKSGMFEILDEEKHGLWMQVNSAFTTFSSNRDRQDEIRAAVQLAVDRYREEKHGDEELDVSFEFDVFDSNDLVDPDILDDDDDDDNPF